MKGHREDTGEQTVEGQCVQVQVCSDWVKETEERIPKKSRKEPCRNANLTFDFLAGHLFAPHRVSKTSMFI